jgi:hypothetical protein
MFASNEAVRWIGGRGFSRTCSFLLVSSTLVAHCKLIKNLTSLPWAAVAGRSTFSVVDISPIRLANAMSGYLYDSGLLLQASMPRKMELKTMHRGHEPTRMVNYHK